MDVLHPPNSDALVILGAPLNNQPFIQVNLIQDKDITFAQVAGKTVTFYYYRAEYH